MNNEEKKTIKVNEKPLLTLKDEVVTCTLLIYLAPPFAALVLEKRGGVIFVSAQPSPLKLFPSIP